MVGLLLDPFQWLVVILYSDMPATDVGMELSRPKHTDTHSCSMLA